MNRNNFIGKVVNDLLSDDFSVLITKNGEHHKLGGSFNGHDREFIVSMTGKFGFEVLIHEYCHYLQWKERKRYYDKLSNGCGIIFDWLGGTFFKKDVVDYALNLVIELEWDCENRSVELIKQYKLDVDLKKYIQTANTYILFYHMVRENRKWLGGSLYSHSLIRSMPPKLMDLDFYLNPDNIKEHQREKYIDVLE